MMYSQKICNEKNALRKELLRKAALLPPENGKISQIVLKSDEWNSAKTVFCYVSYNYEPDTKALLQKALEQGKTLCVPLCEKGGVMSAVKISSLDDLYSGAFGILEPLQASPQIAPTEIDLVIVPCLAADKNNRRLGKGGGYYDRFLAKCKSNCIKILLCRKELLIEAVPFDEHDLAADILIY